MSLKKLKVYYNGWGENWEVGTLAEKSGQIYFQYSTDFLKKNFEISPIRMKKSNGVFQDFPEYLDRLPGFVCDSLPDGWGRLLMDRFFASKGMSIFQISALDRLAFLNTRAMGALSFEPGAMEGMSSKDLDLLTYAKEAQLISEEKESKALIDLLYQGGSPHGARPKAVIRYNPLTNQENEDWLVKFRAATEHKEVCAIEAWYMELAELANLDVMPYGYVDLDSENAAFAVKRFDRVGTQKVLLQTLAGMLHVNYRIPGTLDYLDYLKLVRIVCRDEQEVLKAFRQCVFNVLFNNKDDHSKNFSFQLTKDYKWKCSPAYDLTYCEGPGGEHHMGVLGAGKNISLAGLKQLAEKANIDKTKSSQELDALIELAKSAKNLGEKYAIRGKTLAIINKAVSQNVASLIQSK